MELAPQLVASLGPADARGLLPAWLASTVEADRGPQVRQAVREVLDGAEDLAISQALARFARLGEAYALHPADPLVRRIARAYMACLVLPGSAVSGLDGLRSSLAAGPVLLIGNHLSYVDTQLSDVLLAAQEATLADRLVTIAGPKVYESAFRRFAALGLSTLKTAQSSSVATELAQGGLREVARIAAETVRQAETLMREGHPVLLYPEGTRSRTGQLGPFLRGAARYARLPGLRVHPVGILGSDRVFPVGAEGLRAARVELRLGEAVPIEGLDKDAALERLREALAAVLEA